MKALRAAGAWLKERIRRVRIFKRLAHLEKVNSALVFCEDCRAVMLGGSGVQLINMGQKVGVFCRWCAQRYRARGVTRLKSAH